MKHLKRVLLWYCFFSVYGAIFCLLYIGIPEIKLYEFIYGHGKEISEIGWDNTHMTILLVLDLIITGFCIFMISVFLDKDSSTSG